ncbi:hypothetical protein AMR47_17790 [Leptospira interrogans]|nr:hypothetical protein AMR47_17790 [Leptospira interrogans]KAA1267994.1 hypothetical protein C5473_08245 [Leptospira interrogans serovar Weerasinghe]OOB95553.1 hypothetical protein B0192_20085 [Leptospira interrogans serovar Australis]
MIKIKDTQLYRTTQNYMIKSSYFIFQQYEILRKKIEVNRIAGPRFSVLIHKLKVYLKTKSFYKFNLL